MSSLAAYTHLANEWPTLPRLSPLLAPSTLPSLAYLFLTSAFVLTFYFSTLKRSTTSEVAVGTAAAVSASLGLCAAFSSLGCTI